MNKNSLLLKTPVHLTPPPEKIIPKRREEIEQEAEFFEMATGLSPNDLESLGTLRQIYIELGQDAKTLATWRKIVRAYLNIKSLPEAVATCEAILREFPGDPDTLSLLREAHGNQAPPAS